MIIVEYENVLDNIFLALYGSDTDECGEKYKEIYRYEVKNIEHDIYEYIKLMQNMPFDVSIDDLAKFIVWCEFYHIGNSHYEKNIDYIRLKEIALKILEK